MMPSSSRMLCSSSTTRTRASAMAARDPEREGAATARRRLDVDLAAVILQDAVNEGQSETAAARLGGEERLEDVCHVAPADAVTRIFDPHDQGGVNDAGGHA